VYHFVDSDVLVGGTPIPNLLDSFTLTINNNAQGLGDIRSYTNEAVVIMGRDWSLKVDLNLESITYLTNLLGDTTGITSPVLIETMTITAANGTGNSLTVTLKNLRQSDGMPGITYGDMSKEGLQLEAEYGYFVEERAA
jgi:hypothetical protein